MSKPSIDLRGLNPAPVTPFTRDGAVDHAAIQRLGSWLGSFDGVKGLVGARPRRRRHLPERRRAGRGDRELRQVGRRQHPDHRRHHARRHQGRRRGSQARRQGRRRGRPGLSVARLAALRLPEGRAAGPLPRDLRRERPAADPVPVPGRDQGDLQPRDAARHRRPARRVRDEERRAQHAPLGHRDPGHPPRAPGPADPDLPRRVPAAHDVRRRRRAGRLRRHRARAAGRADRRRQGQGLRQGARAPRPAAAGDRQRLPPRLAHGRHGRAEMGLVARGILDHATVRSPLLPLAEGAEIEIADAMRSAGLGKVN